ncbi:uncharacterized protein LOC120491890 [Pimephales promelas]|uniref:uncharacterized protein LOC120491890 n=1 Tax=Pimephales promelas TaxID=90988 RepID=UPI0019555BF6|nr:uncharacterized protein LOC120491890 [Pimephales promelas]
MRSSTSRWSRFENVIPLFRMRKAHGKSLLCEMRHAKEISMQSLSQAKTSSKNFSQHLINIQLHFWQLEKNVLNFVGTDITANRTAVLCGLPLIFGEDTSDFFKTILDCDCNTPKISIGIITVMTGETQDSSQALHLDDSHTAIILEGAIVMDELQKLPDAMCLLFGLIYAFNSKYTPLKNTFDFIQRLFSCLGHKFLKPKLQSPKNILLM